MGTPPGASCSEALRGTFAAQREDRPVAVAGRGRFPAQPRRPTSQLRLYRRLCVIDIASELAAAQEMYNLAKGRAFIAELPTRVAAFLDLWELQLDGEAMHGVASWCCRSSAVTALRPC